MRRFDEYSILYATTEKQFIKVLNNHADSLPRLAPDIPLFLLNYNWEDVIENGLILLELSEQLEIERRHLVEWSLPQKVNWKVEGF